LGWFGFFVYLEFLTQNTEPPQDTKELEKKEVERIKKELYEIKTDSITDIDSAIEFLGW
jgi:hypothetical protein